MRKFRSRSQSGDKLRVFSCTVVAAFIHYFIGEIFGIARYHTAAYLASSIKSNAIVYSVIPEALRAQDVSLRIVRIAPNMLYTRSSASASMIQIA